MQKISLLVTEIYFLTNVFRSLYRGVGRKTCWHWLMQVQGHVTWFIHVFETIFLVMRRNYVCFFTFFFADSSSKRNPRAFVIRKREISTVYFRVNIPVTRFVCNDLPQWQRCKVYRKLCSSRNFSPGIETVCTWKIYIRAGIGKPRQSGYVFTTTSFVLCWRGTRLKNKRFSWKSRETLCER